MTGIVCAYDLEGSYEYSFDRELPGGTMQGKAVRYDDGKIIGLITDTDKTDPLFKKGFPRYLLGSFHSLGFSFIKFDSMETYQSPIYWAFEKEGREYSGGWQPMRVSPFAFRLKTMPHLRAVSEIEMDPKLLYSFEQDFRNIITNARKVGRIGRLRVKESSLAETRAELRL